MAIIFEWDSKETVKRKEKTVDIHRRLQFIERERLRGKVSKKLLKEETKLKKELAVIEYELKHRHLYE